MMKKLLATILALIMALSLCTVAFGDEAVARIEGKEGTYTSLSDAVAAAEDGDTVTLLKSCHGDGIVIPEGKYPTKGITIDFNGNGYTVGGVLVGSTGTKSNAFQLLKDNKITMKNGAIYGDAATAGDSETTWTGAPAMMIQNYSDLTLLNMTISGGKETVYTMSNNNGNTIIEDTTINAGGGKHNGSGPFAFDVCRYASYTGPSITVKGNSVVNGNIEISSSGARDDAIHELTIESGTFKGTIAESGSNPDLTVVVSGGTFSDQVNHAYLADGLKYEVVNDGKYTYHSTIDEAVAAVGANGRIEAVESVSGGTYTIDYNDGSGKKISIYISSADFELPTMSREGYTFKGWRVMNVDGTSPIIEGVYSSDDVKKMATTGLTVGNVEVRLGDGATLTAIWEKIPARYYYNSTTTTTKDDTKSSPKTFDAGVGIYALTAVLSVTGMACVGKKKF